MCIRDSLYVIEDYRKIDDFIVRINKPNFQNGQNERKLNYNKGLQKKRLFSSPKNKPKQTQFKPCPERSRMGQFLQRPKSLAKKSGHTPTHRDLIVPFTRNHLFGIM